MGQYENRYRHKLNMLEPGTRMLKLAAALASVAGVCALFKWTLAARLLALAAGLVMGILLLLVTVELHQDKILNEIAAREVDDTETRQRKRISTAEGQTTRETVPTLRRLANAHQKRRNQREQPN